jgi:gamma-butyrobetaine dioxygenase
MVKLSSLEDIERLYEERGGRSYGEGVTQIEHALQCANLAVADGAAPSLILAALLHDLGHLLEDEASTAKDHRHEAAGAAALAGLFGPAVRAPIALHVAAKRYLCLSEHGYFGGLSAASRQSLAVQGGPFSPTEARAFEGQPYWREAVALRRWDDGGKRQESRARSFADFAPMIRDLATGGGTPGR